MAKPSPEQNRAVLFDFDGVLTLDHSGSLSQAQNLARVYGIDTEAAYQAIGDFNRSRMTGQATLEQCLPKLWDDLGVELEVEALWQAVRGLALNQGAYDFAQRIRRPDIRTGIFTNQPIESIAAIRDVVPLAVDFDEQFVSAELGAKKSEDERAVYDMVQARLGLPPGAIMFIDNQRKNLKIPKMLGWNSLHYQYDHPFHTLTDAVEDFIS